MSEAPAGWYDDGSGVLRYFDGADWTEHVAGPPTHPAPPSAARKGMPTWGWVVLGAGVVVVLLGLAGVGYGVFRAQHVPVQAATAAIAAYDEAWLNADCDALADATTTTLRNHLGYDDCTAFESEAKDFRESERDYAITFVSKRYEHGKVSVVTEESYSDPDGGRLVDHVTYTVVKDGDTWRIDAIDFDDGKGTQADDHTNV